MLATSIRRRAHQYTIMRSFGLRFRCLCVYTITLILVWIASAVAQSPTTITFRDSRSEIVELLQNGRELEQQRRWVDAFAHYEQAVRRYPDDGALQQRFNNVRLHYDLERRYADRSFLTTALPLSAEQAFDLYNRALLKIEENYVDVPQWKRLVVQGATNFELALEEPVFVQWNIRPKNRIAIEAFCRELQIAIRSRDIRNRVEADNVVAAVARLAEERLAITPTAVVFEFLCGAISTLDPYSSYLTPNQLNASYAQIEGNYVGLGFDLDVQHDELVVQQVLHNSPAEEAGIRVDDRIFAIDHRRIKDLTADQIDNLLRGPEGKMVTLSVAARDRAPRDISVCFRRIETPSIRQINIVDSQSGIGYFKLTSFQRTTAHELDVALWQLYREGMKSLIIDMRGNGGGSLISAVEVVDRFIDRGVIVSTRGRIAQENLVYSAHEQAKWQTPLVLMIDQDTASAAEIVAGAIRDHHRGTIVGTRSFGKGTVQLFFPLEGTNAGIRLTIAKFYSPNGQPFSHIGVEPDIAIWTVARPINGVRPDDTDATMGAALQTARNLGQPFQSSYVR